MAEKRTILIAVTGMTPQVVTETLYALLVHRNQCVDEIHILTTADGKARLLQMDIQKQIEGLCRRYNKQCPVFDLAANVHVAQEESIELSDIRTDRDNALFPDMIVDMIQKKTSDAKTNLHCSIAGGRKTMSVSMAYALSLYGRKEDSLSHVLVSKEFEQSGKFYPENDAEDKQLILTEIPYIRLREKLPLLKEYPTASYSELVSITQEEIERMIMIPRIVVERKMRRVVIEDHHIVLTPFQFALYCFFLEKKKFVSGGKQFKEKDARRLWNIYKQCALSEGHRERAKKTIWRGNTIEFNSILKGIAQIKRQMRQIFKDDPLLEHYIISVRGSYGAKEYGILLDKAHIVWR